MNVVAVNLVHDLSTDDSPGFVNGVLDAIARTGGSARTGQGMREDDTA